MAEATQETLLTIETMHSSKEHFLPWSMSLSARRCCICQLSLSNMIRHRQSWKVVTKIMYHQAIYMAMTLLQDLLDAHRITSAAPSRLRHLPWQLQVQRWVCPKYGYIQILQKLLTWWVTLQQIYHGTMAAQINLICSIFFDEAVISFLRSRRINSLRYKLH